MRTMNSIKLLAALAWVLGAGPAMAAPSETFSPTCEIDTNALTPTDLARLPEEVRGKSYVVGGEVPFSQLQCTRSQQSETLQLSCVKEVQLSPGTLATEFTTKDFECFINLGDCIHPDEKVPADNETFKVRFGVAPDTIVLDLFCTASKKQ